MTTQTLHKRLSLSVALFLLFSLFVNTVVYACSGRYVQRKDLNDSATTQNAAGESPCADQNGNHNQDEDVCKAVRDRMLSIQPSSSQDGQKAQFVTLDLLVTTPFEPVLPKIFEDRRAILHPVFAISLPVSFLVLRI